MINNITKYFAQKEVLNNKGPLSKISNVKLQYQQIASINKILTTFFKIFFILISKPIYTITPNGIKISILYFMPTAPAKKKNQKLKFRKENKKQTQSTNQLNGVRLEQGEGVRLQKAYLIKYLEKETGYKYKSPTQSTQLRFEAKRRNKFSRSRLTFLVLLLSKLLKTNVQLELVRLKYVYHDSNILAQFLGINSHRNTYGKFKNLLWKKVSTFTQANPLPNELGKINETLQINDFSPITQLTGFKIKISGRLAKQRVVPKKTVKTTYKGAISPNKHNLVEQATFTGKNKKGAYSIRVWTSHGTTPKFSNT